MVKPRPTSATPPEGPDAMSLVAYQAKVIKYLKKKNKKLERELMFKTFRIQVLEQEKDRMMNPMPFCEDNNNRMTCVIKVREVNGQKDLREKIQRQRNERRKEEKERKIMAHRPINELSEAFDNMTFDQNTEDNVISHQEVSFEDQFDHFVMKK